ncbi:L-glutamate gamma-semialdehyde dehydrogenase [Paenibacillus doosanensis]|uniref:L-glutamate gamma-semialdehyde dehydrogenase n=1 Tax=Paenibacillus doosanensis TaxID=1229154 RepID=UPI0021808A4E|nr:L-glutamate gamma-semialdehyde dehydrogenase [Paenibacillus doosanensis]MCS7460430.1 L-glutamate gamma-semialdehyde dehydrogenase [Paenibacillus doosanensis]
MKPYQPEPLTDFTRPEESRRLEEALGQVQSELGRTYPLLIGGEAIETEDVLVSLNPSRSDQIIGKVAKADRSWAEKAIQSAAQTFRSWSKTPAVQRAEYLLKGAATLRRRKHEFNAWLMLEAGKSRVEADADTAEAIDFLEYYARQMIALSGRGGKELIPLAGEHNELHYIPLGVGIVIPPWNFPLAIMAGMTTAAVVAGNTVVLKPSSQTPVIAAKFVELMYGCGLPSGVIQFAPGSGSEIGDYLVEHPLARFVSFTGSRDVGVRIQELSARVAPGQIWLKRFVGELGGKDSILVDAEADLEAAARGIVASAFGYSGQKCSACSRAIVHQDVYETVLSRCKELTQALKVGDVTDMTVDTGPVIDRASFQKIMDYIDIAKEEGRIVTGGQALPLPGYFIEPTIVADAAIDSRIMQEEIFGPVVAFASCKDFDEGLAMVNDSEYGLTGSVYSNNREHIARAKAEFHVGNLYINRKCTGAVVGVHPFGGFNMSGTDSKAGGPDYLLLFTQSKAISELL